MREKCRFSVQVYTSQKVQRGKEKNWPAVGAVPINVSIVVVGGGKIESSAGTNMEKSTARCVR